MRSSEGVEGGFAEKALEKGDMDDPAELQELAAAMMIRLDGGDDATNVTAIYRARRRGGGGGP